YISGEVKIKYMEGKLWGTMMGPFGGCYAIRAEYFKQVPDNFLVDDFFIAMNVFDKGGKAVNELEAICYESVSHELKEEFRRKSRISAGNYQNLFTYFHLLSPLRGKLAFTFFSHKFLRWMGPFLIIMALVSSLVLMLLGNVIFAGFFGFLMILIIIIPIFDVVLQNVGIHLRLFRSVRYFFMMNLALLKGFFKYIKGIESNVWQPTKRTDSVEHDS
ncbi:MAG: glycosyltransferase family 2 protein, partial [Saprospiraceae bacterium]